MENTQLLKNDYCQSRNMTLAGSTCSKEFRDWQQKKIRREKIHCLTTGWGSIIGNAKYIFIVCTYDSF